MASQSQVVGRVAAAAVGVAAAAAAVEVIRGSEDSPMLAVFVMVLGAGSVAIGVILDEEERRKPVPVLLLAVWLIRRLPLKVERGVWIVSGVGIMALGFWGVAAGL